MRLMILLVASLLMAMPARAQGRDPDWDDCVRQETPDQGIRGCTAVLNRGARETPGNRAIAYSNRALALHNSGNGGAALLDYGEAIRLDPRLAAAFSGRARLHRERGSLDAAMADYNEAIRLDPRNSLAFNGRGATHRDRGNLDAAMEDYNEAIRLDPRNNFSLANRGNIHRDRGSLDAAMADYSEAIRLDPRNSHSFNGRGNVHRDRGNLDAAMADYSEAIRLDPRNSHAFNGRGATHRDRGSLDAAMADYNEAIRLDPRFAVASNNRGLLHLSMGNLSAAQADLRRAVELGFASASTTLADVDRRLASQGTPPSGQVAAPAAPRPAETAPPPATTERRVALVIGNGIYRATGVSPLPNPARDARAMAALFRDLGFTHVALHLDLDQAGMLRALREFEREAERADWAVVYFAGHGVEINGTNHLVPVDAQLRSDRDVPDEAVPLHRVLARLEGARKLRLVILDACRDNPFLARMQRVATRNISRGLAPIDDGQMPAGTMVAFAARAGQVAEDGTAENSPFVQALRRRLPEPGVEINLLFRRVRDDVLAATGRRQEPFTYASLPGEELFMRRR